MGKTKSPPGAYVVTFNDLTARFEFTNDAIRFNGGFVLYTKESLENPNKPATFPDIQYGNGVWRLMGLEEGMPIFATPTSPVVVANAAPNLQANTQLFLKSNIGIAAQSVGPRGNQSVVHRIIMDAPGPFALVVDRHATSWNSIAIPGNTTIPTDTQHT